MKILTGNDLTSGAVIWWTGSDWSLHIEDVVALGGDAESIAAREESARRVNGPYAIDAEEAEGGRLRPAHIKERIRATGPTVRPDLAIEPADPTAGNWVI